MQQKPKIGQTNHFYCYGILTALTINIFFNQQLLTNIISDSERSILRKYFRTKKPHGFPRGEGEVWG